MKVTKTENVNVKIQAMLKGVRLYEVAQYCHMSESTFNRRMRQELSQADCERFLRAIEEIAAEKNRAV